MSLQNLSSIYTRDEFLEKIDKFADISSHITFYCSSLNDFYPYKLSNPLPLGPTIINKLFNFKCSGDNKKVDIVTNYYFNKDSLFDDVDKDNISSYGIKPVSIPIDNKGNKTPLKEFGESLKKLVCDLECEKWDERQKEIKKNTERSSHIYHKPTYKSDIKTLSAAINFITDHFDECKDKLIELLEKLKKDINTRIDKIPKEEKVDASIIKQNIDTAFNEIINNLKKINDQSSYYIIKEIIKFILGLVDVTNIKSTFKKSNLILALPDLVNTGINIYEYSKKKGYYALASPVAKLLCDDFGFIFNLINTTSICNILVFKSAKDAQDGYFIDFSGFDELGLNLNKDDMSHNIDVNLDEYMAVYGEIEGDIDIFAYDKVKNYSAIDIDYIYESINKNFGSNMPEKDSLFGKIKNSIIQTDASLVYIQAPYFNSLKFANLISGKTNEEHNNSSKFSGINKNYLVISNAPLKQNAGLSDYIIQTALEQKIDDDINRKRDKTLTKDSFGNPDNIQPVKDYSHYSIDTKAKDEKDAYILSLSPFARVDQDTINNFYKNIQDEWAAIDKMRYNYSYNEQDFGEIHKKSDIAKLNLSHINLYAKQPEEIEEIKKKEKIFLDESVAKFKLFFENINQRYITVIQGSKSDTPIIIKAKLDDDEKEDMNAEEFELPYSMTDIFLMAISFYIMKQMYDVTTIIKNKKGFFDRIFKEEELLSIGENDGFKVLNAKASINLNGYDIPLYFFKESAEESGSKTYICIEDISDKFKGYSLDDSKRIFNENFYTFIENFEKQNQERLNNISDVKASDAEEEGIKLALAQQNKNIKQYEHEIINELKKVNNRHQEELKEILKVDTISKDYVDEVMTSIAGDMLEALCPFASYITEGKYDGFIKNITKVMFENTSFASALMSELGAANIFTSFTISDANINVKLVPIKGKKLPKFSNHELEGISFFNIFRAKKSQYHIKYKITEGSKKNLKKLEEARRKIGNISLSIKKDIAKIRFKNYMNLGIRTLASAGVTALVDVYMTEYEKLKKEFETIFYKRFVDKYNGAYSLTNISPMPINHEDYHTSKTKMIEYTYYPITIYSSSISVNLKDMFIGGRFCTGGLDYHSFMFYHINSTNLASHDSLPRAFPLSRLATYLCLDELRTRYYDDPNYFRNAVGDNGIRTRLLDLTENEHKEIYEAYRQSQMRYVRDTDSQKLPIDYYQEAMEILQDYRNGLYNVDGYGHKDDKARRLMKALDIIGNNNVKGMYVGVRAPKDKPRTEEDIPPRIIGRLATTIIMEDGLFLG
ncbi:hypothetical protein [Campylobacter curvus]|uniref:hypothetical protein n=1 Tax=Campylobacter curvus TaxID=200 RepID=UPI00146FE15C|nr:hypothetical protein [Campylobacter curvus]